MRDCVTTSEEMCMKYEVFHWLKALTFSDKSETVTMTVSRLGPTNVN